MNMSKQEVLRACVGRGADGARSRLIHAEGERRIAVAEVLGGASWTRPGSVWQGEI